MEKVKNYLLENIEELKDVVRELNGWNGCMESFDVFENDEEFFSLFFEGKPMEAVRAAHYGEYNYADDFVRFNGYGNLESLSEYQYEKELKEYVDEIVAELENNLGNVEISDELEELFQEDEE